MSPKKYVLLTKEFWADTSERVVSTAAQAVVAVVAADQAFPNAFDLDYKVLAGVAAGGALGALVKVLAKLGATAPVATTEILVPRPPTDEEIAGYLRLQASGGDVERTIEGDMRESLDDGHLGA